MVNRVAIIESGKVSNIALANDEIAAENGWVISDTAKIGDTYDGGVFTTPETVIEVPKKISARQAKQELHALGKLSLVQSVIDAIADPDQKMNIQIYWNDATDFERTHPELIALATAIDMDGDQLNDAFISAAKR